MSKTVISQVPRIAKGYLLCLRRHSLFQFSCQGEQEVLARMEVEVQSARLLTWKVADYHLVISLFSWQLTSD